MYGGSAIYLGATQRNDAWFTLGTHLIAASSGMFFAFISGTRRKCVKTCQRRIVRYTAIEANEFIIIVQYFSLNLQCSNYFLREMITSTLVML